MATTDRNDLPLDLPEPLPADNGRPRQKAVTIGAVCKALELEFPDISISKIRYLEDQKLLTPRRTQGGYRLYTPDDVQRLRTILRLQRDEFLPLRVIRQELAGGGHSDREVGSGADAHTLRRTSVTRDPGALYSLEDVVEETGADPKLVERARRVRRDQGRGARRGTLLRRHRARDRARRLGARPLRGRRPQPTCVPHIG